jgi:hypothetical protein
VRKRRGILAGKSDNLSARKILVVKIRKREWGFF